MVKRTFGVDFYSSGGALTLRPEEIGKNKSGWSISGEIHDDWCEWVNYFEASHPDFGWVKGNFEGEVKASSKKAFDHFLKHHEPSAWDYQDI